MCYDIAYYEKKLEKLEQRSGGKLSFDGWLFKPSVVDESFEPHYHVSAHRTPDPYIPVITNEEPHKLNFYHWGLCPPWMKKFDDRWSRKMANAKVETLLASRSYKFIAPYFRCVIPVTGFFEWRWVKGKSYPYFIYLSDQELFPLAGIWYYNKAIDLHTVSIITTAANALLEVVHNKRKRMPVILSQENMIDWLEPMPNGLSDSDKTEWIQQKIDRIKIPFPSEKMEAHPIRKIITNRGADTDVPELTEPYDYPELKMLDLK